MFVYVKLVFLEDVDIFTIQVDDLLFVLKNRLVLTPQGVALHIFLWPVLFFVPSRTIIRQTGNTQQILGKQETNP